MATGYLVFPDIKSAQGRSNAEALARGCRPGDATQWWWETREHPLAPGAFLLLFDAARPDFDKSKLAANEKALIGADPAVLVALDTATSTPAGTASGALLSRINS